MHDGESQRNFNASRMTFFSSGDINELMRNGLHPWGISFFQIQYAQVIAALWDSVSGSLKSASHLTVCSVMQMKDLVICCRYGSALATKRIERISFESFFSHLLFSSDTSSLTLFHRTRTVLIASGGSTTCTSPVPNLDFRFFWFFGSSSGTKGDRKISQCH